MNTKKTGTLATKDATRRPFLPIQMDLVDRLTRQADTLTGQRPTADTEDPGDASSLAA